ncbi:MAG TPA: MaoC/PaaZ C-terminal domain-containing protein [Polyangiaceae bacterium]|nr:MaoC/PaaZ C-terminal domain-containing protein [Polyangiaceae bacterium]
MNLDLSTVGQRTEAFPFEYDFHQTILYALGVGARKEELDFLYEGRGPKVLPSFAVVPSYAATAVLFERTRSDLTRLLHQAQTVRLHRPLPAAAKLETVGIVKGIYDMKRFAQIVLVTESTCRGELLFETEWTLIVRDAGNFGGPRPPKSEIFRPESGQEPAFKTEASTSPEQALLYRLCGDLNPLHADPEFAQAAGFNEGPILHGLCTFGVATRAIVQHLGGDVGRVRSLSAQFRKPVWPGDTIRTEGYALANGRLAFEAFAADRPDPVLTQGLVELNPV